MAVIIYIRIDYGSQSLKYYIRLVQSLSDVHFILAVVYAASLFLFLLIIFKLDKTNLRYPVKVFLLCIIISFLYSSFGYYARFHHGNIYLLLVLAETGMIDISSYFIGKSFGKHHIFPKLSPNKSLEGYIGGIAIPIAVLTAVTVILSISKIVAVNWIEYALFTVCVAAAALFGDLAMSAVKRIIGVIQSYTSRARRNSGQIRQHIIRHAFSLSVYSLHR